MPVPNTFATATAPIPLSQLDTNFATPITLGNTAIQLGNTVTTLNNMTFANATITSGNVTITNVSVTTANVTTANITTAIIGTANVTTANVTTGIIGTANVTTGNITTAVITTANVATANIATEIVTTSQTLNYGTANAVVYLNGSKVSTTGTALQFDGTNLGLGVTPSAWGSIIKALESNNGVYFGAQTNATPVLFIGANNYYDTDWRYKVSGQAASNYRQLTGQHQWYTAPSGTAGNTITFTQAMTLDASGNLGIGTTTPGAKLEVALNTTGTAEIKVNNANAGSGAQSRITLTGSSKNLIVGSTNDTTLGAGGFIYVDTASPLTFFTNATERARITSGGDFLVATTDAALTSGVGQKIVYSATAPKIAIVGSASTNASTAYSLYSTGAGAYRFYVDYSGTISATTTTITGISDVRLKENIRDLDDGLDAVMLLKPRKFDWKEGKGANTKDARGFIAQEFEQVFPDMIEQWMDEPPEGEEPYKAVNANLIPTLVKAIQELKAELDATKAKVAALENA